VLWPSSMARAFSTPTVASGSRWCGGAVESRLHLVPRFRQLLYAPRRGLGGPLWVDAPDFDLSDHVQVAPLPAPADEAELLEAIERLRRRRLDRTRPLWGMWFLPGLRGAGSACS
jgi:diacylglycerol O-acyltransferase / wax synthase